MKKNMKKMVALLMCVLMCISLMPEAVFAEDTNSVAFDDSTEAVEPAEETSAAADETSTVVEEIAEAADPENTAVAESTGETTLEEVTNEAAMADISGKCTKSVVCDSSGYPESDHDIDYAMSQQYDYSYSGAYSLTVTFSAETQTQGWSRITITDKNGNTQGVYHGTELADQTVTVEGDTIYILLETEILSDNYGFAIDKIVAEVVLADQHNFVVSAKGCKGTTYTCDNGCGTSYSDDDYSAAVGHEFNENGKCKNCTATKLYSGTCGSGLIWTVGDDGLLTVSGTGAMDNYSVNNPAPWNQYADTITMVIIAPNVTSIGTCAFAGCSNVTDVVISANVTSIGDGAFALCSNVKQFFVNADNTSYCADDGILFNKDKTTLVAFPATITGSYEILSGVTEIGAYAFSDADISTVTIPETVTKIGEDAFAECESLTELTIPANVIAIGDGAFTGCTKLVSIQVATQNTAYCSLNGMLLNKARTELLAIPAAIAVDYTIPSTVSKIGAYALAGSNLSDFVIPDSVTIIGAYAFENCAVEELTVPASVTSIEDMAFADCADLERITFEGNAPVFGTTVFYRDNLTAFYTSSNTGWSAAKQIATGGNVIWSDPEIDTIAIDTEHFPDSAFMSCVQALFGADSATYAQFWGVTELDVSDKGICNLTGIELFENLTTLDCSGNELTAVNLMGNTTLTSLNCSSNKLIDQDGAGVTCDPALIVSANPLLTSLNCSNNGITTLTLKENTKLTSLDCNNNSLISINLNNCPMLTKLNCSNNQMYGLSVINNLKLTSLNCSNNDIEYLNLSQNTKLTSLDCSGNSDMTALDLSHNYLLNTGNVTMDSGVSVTWATAGEVLLDETNFPDDVFCGYVQSLFSGADSATIAQLAAVTEVNLDDNLDYVGVGDLTGIEYFTGLTVLKCGRGQNIKTLDVSQNTQLQVLVVESNSLTTIDLSNNLELTTLRLGSNDLTELDVSNNPELTYLSVGNNELTTLDVSKNTKLQILNCNGNKLLSLDISGLPALTNLNCQDNKLAELDVSANSNLTWLDCSGNNLAALNMKESTALEHLNCMNNQLSALDVSKCQKLTYLACSNNELATLNVKNNPDLISLFCACNNLTTLDVSVNTALQSLNCSNNCITELNLASNLQMTEASLTCDATVNVIWDDGTVVQLNAANFPDETFRNYIANLFTKDGTTPTALTGRQIYSVTELDVSNMEISDLTGIEYFINLTMLDCRNNTLTSLDISKNAALQNLNCSGNKLTELNVEKNTALISLDCSDNNLASLDVSSNTALTTLICSYNKISSNKLNVVGSNALQSLDCSANQITSLDLSTNTALTTLDCSLNDLLNLDVSANEELVSLNCKGNINLTTLDVSANAFLTEPKGNVQYDDTVTVTWDNSEIIAIDATNFPDANFRTNVTNLFGSSATVKQFAGITELDVSYQGVEDMTGIAYFTNLTSLNCKGNAIKKTVDLTNNKKLTPANVSINEGVEVIYYSAVIPGDCNGDGVVNLKDLLVLKKYLSGTIGESEIDLEAAEVTGDGAVNLKDLLVLRRYLAGVTGAVLQ